MKQIELLAPAGSMETLIAAVNGGANAVYLGGKSFGARRSALNFSNDEIAEAIRYCHERHVSVYVTVNTLIKETEIHDVMSFIDDLYRHDVDAIILQDIGLLHHVKTYYPDLHCHASTQMTFHDLAGVKAAQNLGFSRVVLSRELSFEEIKSIAEAVAIEIEFFVHGALCISYSGQCQMSSYIGGRSGNRGACAQPCRKQYTVINNTTGQTSKKAYLLSPKDLMTYEQIDKLRELKNISLKIEGRMKGADYVYSIVEAYRKGLDQGFEKEQVVNFSRTFNRQFTTGFMFGEPYAQIMNYELPSSFGVPLGTVNKLYEGHLELKLIETLNKGDEIQFRISGETVGTRTDVIMRDGIRVVSAAKGDVVTVPFKYNAPKGALFYKTYDREYIDDMFRKSQIQRAVHTISFKCTVALGKKVQLEAQIDDLTYAFESERLAEVALNRPLDETRLIEQLSKLGGTPFHIGELDIHLGDNLSVPISEINLLRRKCLDAILDDLSVRYKDRITGDYQLMTPTLTKKQNQPKRTPMMLLVFDHIDLLLRTIAEKQKINPSNQALQFEYLLTDLNGYLENLEYLMREGVVPVLPRIIRSDDSEKITTFLHAYSKNTLNTTYTEGRKYKVCLTHIGQIERVKALPLSLIADYSMHALNAMSGVLLKELGFEQMVWSTELSKDELIKVESPGLSNAVFIYGHLPLMISEYCPVGGVFTGRDNCGLCATNTFSLVDERGAVYPLVCDPSRCRTEVMSNLPISLFDHMPMLVKNGYDAFRVSIDSFNPEAIEIMVKLMHLEHLESIGQIVIYNPESHSRGNFNRGIE